MTLAKSAIITSLFLAVAAAACPHHGPGAHDSHGAQLQQTSEKTYTAQKTCPVMGAEIKDDLYIEQDGKRIYVCCAGCVDAVKKDFNKYLAKLEELGEKPELVEVETEQEE